MQPATSGTITSAQHNFLPAVTHEKAMDHSAGTKSIGSRDRTLCPDCPGAVLLVGLVCAMAIASVGGTGSTPLPTPDCSGAALLHPLSAISFIVALMPHGPALRQAGADRARRALEKARVDHEIEARSALEVAPHVELMFLILPTFEHCSSEDRRAVDDRDRGVEYGDSVDRAKVECPLD